MGDPALDSISNRALWLAVRMIHEANSVRLNHDGVKVGGHQASSASVISILVALYFSWLRPQDLVSVKPHASPAYHAIRYLLGDLDPSYLTALRSYGGLQSYPSRTKDPDRVDFSTGSVGLGAVAPLFAALADRYVRMHFPEGAHPPPARRFVALVGDAELDEGNVWEAVLEEALLTLGNVTVIVDVNRQSLDRVIPGIRANRLAGVFRAAGWQVLEAKYGRRLKEVFDRPNGDKLRRSIDDMTNEEYQVLIRRPDEEIRTRLIDRVPADERDVFAKLLSSIKDGTLPGVLANLGGHDIDEILDVLHVADGDTVRPAVVFAYTIKGWRLPIAGDAMNHSALLTSEQLETLAPTLGADVRAPWAAFPEGTREYHLCAERGNYLRDSESPGRPMPPRIEPPPTIEFRSSARMSSQQTFGDAMSALARHPDLGPRLVTASPDVAVSTNLGGWINRVGVFSVEETRTFAAPSSILEWKPSAAGQHIELGISEMNLFMWLGQFGLTAEMLGELLIPVGTVYDPFICRGLDALIYSSYIASRFVVVGTPSGISLAGEGGAHQSTITPSIGIELPGLRMYEPVFAQELIWCLMEGIRGCVDREDGFSTYLRLSTRPIEQRLADNVKDRLGESEWRHQTLAGGYRLIEARTVAPELPVDAPIVNVFAEGTVVVEAAAAVHALIAEEVAANLIVVTSAERLASELHVSRVRAAQAGARDHLGHLSILIPRAERRASIVTVLDGASHALGFLGSAFGAPVVPLGVDEFGQSGTVDDLFRFANINTDAIINAAILAVELGYRDEP